MQDRYSVRPLGRVASSRQLAIDDSWDSETSEILLDLDVLGPESTVGLDAFSHVEVIYLFDQVEDDAVVNDARHPRGNLDWPRVGILAQRGKNRPNRIGATMCELTFVRRDAVGVRGLDAIDGTPVLDIKPVMSGFLPRGDVKEPQWSVEIMEAYW